MEYFAEGSTGSEIGPVRIEGLIESMLAKMGRPGRVLLVPPDFTRYPSGSGEITSLLYRKLSGKARHAAVIPALGTHRPMTEAEMASMFPGIPRGAFVEHDWRGRLAPLGDVPASLVESESEGILRTPIRWEVNPLIFETPWDRIISIGQLLPHEVTGISNHSKNILVGLGGAAAIGPTHYIAAVFGRERIMGRVDSPLRTILNFLAEGHLAALPITYLMTVRGRQADGKLVTRGIYAGDEYGTFRQAAGLCRQVNITLLDQPLKKIVVYLDPQEYKSTWLGNKAVYRTSMALADGGELIVLAPGVEAFGEDPAIDALIRRYGYRGRRAIREETGRREELRENLGAAAGLINGSSDGRFSITYCTPGTAGGSGLSREDIESVGYAFAPLETMSERYPPGRMREGFNTMPDGEVVYFISDPGLGLWARRPGE